MIESPQLWLPDRLRERREDERLMRQAGLGWQRRWMPQNPCGCGVDCIACSGSAPSSVEVYFDGVSSDPPDSDCADCCGLLTDTFILSYGGDYTNTYLDVNAMSDKGDGCVYYYDGSEVVGDTTCSFDFTLRFHKVTATGVYKIALYITIEQLTGGWGGVCVGNSLSELAVYIASNGTTPIACSSLSDYAIANTSQGLVRECDISSSTAYLTAA